MSTVNDLLNILSSANERNSKNVEEEEETGKVVIKRYFPGKVPHYAKDTKDSEEEEEDEEEEEENEEEENEEEENEVKIKEESEESEKSEKENELKKTYKHKKRKKKIHSLNSIRGKGVGVETIKIVEESNIPHFLTNKVKGNLEDERYKRFVEEEKEKEKEEQKQEQEQANENHVILGKKEDRLKRRVRNVVVLNEETNTHTVTSDKVGIVLTDDMTKGKKRKKENADEDKEKEKEKERERYKERYKERNGEREREREREGSEKKNKEDDENYEDEKDEANKEDYEEDYEEEDEEEEEDEDDDDSYMEDEEEAENNTAIDGDDAKPNFILKNSRQTLTKKKQAEEMERQKMEILEKEKNLIQQEQKENAIKEALYPEMVEEELKQNGLNVLSSDEEFDQKDEEYDEETKKKEYELWKIREINRLKRDYLEREKYNILEEKIKKRRKMTDKEILEDNKNLPNKQKKKKTKMLFLQKYYHRGGFYQDLFEEGKEEIYKRDYTEPVYEDKIDKTKLPKVLRVRRGTFGKQGRTKYTHLLDNDTSIKDSLWKQGEVHPQSKKKTDLLERPTYKKKE